ncbi:Chalcone--flavonone isomerase [Actinidia chinensis var. chinensis]|uniref:Chalcone-flavonone isomerase family protein n=1 Tax=Actinidia chinensis var. chinensis TaxID=1590841 RepID=A0A2R6PLC7_ACTCC|nr:Chalcone--flavonone isomerase [Actinidia chinensis var. chinensis]
MSLSQSPFVTEVQVENYVFPPTVKPPGTTKTLFLGGAGVRGLDTEGEFVKYTAIGVYLEDKAIESLAVKWKGKTEEELMDSIDFFSDIVTGPFEKFTHVKMIRHLTGKEFVRKVGENCLAYWKSSGIHNAAAGEALERFTKVFEDEYCPPGAAVLFTQSPYGSITISFSKDGLLPETGKAVIENKQVSETVLQTIIGKNGVSPAAKQSLAARISQFLNKYSA